MFKFNFNKSNTSTIISSYTISKRTVDYLPINNKRTSHNLNINDLIECANKIFVAELIGLIVEKFHLNEWYGNEKSKRVG